MNKATDPVLEFLQRYDIAVPQGVVKYNLQRCGGDAPSPATIERAFPPAEQYGLIRRAPGSDTYYELTDAGRAYLAGELDASDLEGDGG